MFNIAQQRVQMLPGPGAAIPTGVWYEGSDELSPGYALCANTDYGTAATADSSRLVRAEKPASGNLLNFLGVVADTGRTYQGPCEVPIYAPGSVCYGCTDLTATTLGTTLLTVQAGSYELGGVGEGLVVGLARQTIAAAGKVLMNVFGVQPNNYFDTLLARARTTVQLPTKAIWDNFDLAMLRSNPHLGSLLDMDFNNPGDYPWQTFKDTDSTILLANTQIGELPFLATVDDEAAEAQWSCPILLTGGTPWAFGARLKVSSVTTEKGSFEIGLSNAQVLAGDLQADGGATPTTGTDYLIYNTDAAATTALDLDYLLSGQSHTEHDAALYTMEADTYFTVELYYNGTTIAQYLNGVVVADPIAASDIIDGNFPAAQVCVPTIGVKAAHGDNYIVTLDWIRAAQYGA